ncbi:hypothetical protein HELRODRAFT_69928, partial [Helobdella robusta]|uniref:Protein kinase domain-containing protein n=1 Tax=Helobdella robusta TaxID=6412 RepID=T1G000_HELRO
IDINSIEILEQLGKGQYGIVNRGMYLGKIEVAIKTMTIGALEDDFIEEAFTMTNLQHDNLVKLYGVCTKTSPIRIVTEYLKNGSLLLYLQKHKQRFIFNVDSLVEMCIEVARGMTYLEQNKIIHRDLAARNCLVDEKGLVKVGDFGLARYVLDNEYISSKGTKFPVRWASPEIIMHSMFSSKSDVWAYGVLVWEIFTCGQLPYGPRKNVDIANEISKGSLNLERPPLSCEVTYNIMKSCWKMVSGRWGEDGKI